MALAVGYLEGAAAVGFDVLARSAGAQLTVVSPLDLARRAREGTMPPPPTYLRRRIGG
ncbi:hypothetical protein JF732_14755 [Mycobacterium intracellulare]|uniref:Uncharacterized protein n=1 Tax=Mycobacterium intracellulare TaxID=1767 RepID=A0AAE4RG28_MYCIT|nr:hypothetical protein [Mycobacterium intracellulare]MCA2321560.1 hypothetical protein [Mycobacterium intracellulare]MCA2341806.1 hypothetical protein [Mycobacterium intracellulare]MDV6977907.1 hypothetical protein [Mycobacterium intracellulare]MDV6983321.1 hypothetical protein [Mycobacterium intracellulare]MDV7014343.1 hypothetical protein [Mycobacterium intracellulare]